MAKFLMIEDDELPAEAVATALRGAGHNITTAVDGFCASKALDTGGPIDLLLRDLVMLPDQPSGLAVVDFFTLCNTEGLSQQRFVVIPS